MTDIPVKQKLLSFEEILEERISAADLSQDPPENEEARQYYFIKKARLLADQLQAELGRPLTFILSSSTPVRSGTTRTSGSSAAWAGSPILKSKIP